MGHEQVICFGTNRLFVQGSVLRVQGSGLGDWHLSACRRVARAAPTPGEANDGGRLNTDESISHDAGSPSGWIEPEIVQYPTST